MERYVLACLVNMNEETMSNTARNAQQDEEAISAARKEFREALIQSYLSRKDIGQMEAAAAQFCQALRRSGQPPERMLIDAKRVIEEAIDGDDVAMAERAVSSCIQHYYRE